MPRIIQGPQYPPRMPGLPPVYGAAAMSSFGHAVATTGRRVFISTAPMDTPKTGDVDYAATLVRELTAQGIRAEHVKDKTLSGDDIVRSILMDREERSKVGDYSAPVLHLMLNADHNGIFTGSTLTLRHLEKLKAEGIKLVVTPIEFSKVTISRNELNRNNFYRYFNLADSVIFVDDMDKNTAASLCQKDLNLQRKLSGSAIIGICNTVPLPDDKIAAIDQKQGNFLYFGMIRPFKGLKEYILPLGEYLHQARSQREVIIAGSVNPKDPSLFAELLVKVYPEQARFINDMKYDAERLKHYYHTRLKPNPQCRAANVTFECDAAEDKLPEVFNRCRFSLCFIGKGLSPHFSGFTNTILGKMRSFGLLGHMTPPSFQAGGKDAYLTRVFDPSSPDISREILNDARTFESRPDFMLRFEEERQRFLTENPIDSKSVAKAHSDIYHQL